MVRPVRRSEMVIPSRRWLKTSLVKGIQAIAATGRNKRGVKITAARMPAMNARNPPGIRVSPRFV
jgi:hypothetical protein